MDKNVLILMIFFFLSHSVFALEYYVDTDSIGGGCSDSNPGTIDLPFCTLGQAESVSLPGDRIYVRAGIYREELKIDSYGDDGSPIVYEAYDGETVVIDGSEIISSWTPCPSQDACLGNPNWQEIYYTQIDYHTDKLFEDGVLMTNAREPDFGYYNSTKGSSGFSVLISHPSSLEGTSGDYRGALAEFQGTSTTASNDRNNLIYDKYVVTDYDDSSGQMFFDYSNMTPLWGHSFDDFLGEVWFYLRNKVNFIDRPGEWALVDYFSDAPYTIYFWPHGSDPSGSVIEAARRQEAITGIFSSENLVFKGIDVRKTNKYPTINYGTGFSFNSGARNIIINDSEMSYNQKAIVLRQMDGFVVDGCYVHDNYDGFIFGSGLDGPSIADPQMNHIIDTEIGPNGGDAIQIYSEANITVKNSYLHNHISDRKHSDNFQTRAVSGVFLYNNTIHDGGQNLVIQDTDNMVLEGNLIYNSHARSLLLDTDTNDDLLVKGNTFGYSYYMLLITFTDTIFEDNLYDTGDHYPVQYIHDYLDRIAYSNYNYYPDYVTIMVHGNPWTQIDIPDWQAMGFDLDSIFEGGSSFANVPSGVYSVEYFYERDDIRLKDISDVSDVFSVGDIIEYANDGVARIVTGVDKDSIQISPALPYDNIGSMWGNYVLHWGSNTDITEDYTPSGNVCTGSSSGSYIGAVACEKTVVDRCMGNCTNNITQYGITWTFDKEYEYGRFVNGDYWVVGPVNITFVDPSPVIIDGEAMHGSMIDPGIGQSYDSRTYHYDGSSSVDFPVLIDVDSSLVSTISNIEAECDVRGGQEPGAYDWTGFCSPFKPGRPYVKTAAVLTVVGENVPEGTFRPSFNGEDKRYHHEDQIRWDIIPSFTPPDNMNDNETYYLRGLERPWLMHIPDWSARSLHPSLNMFNNHSNILSFVQAAFLTSLLDIPYKEELVKSLIQNGIDTYGLVLQGHGSSAVGKLPVLFAGTMLDDPEMLNLYMDNISKTPFREDWMTYYPEDGESLVQSTIVPQGQGWTGQTVLFRQDPGNAGEHEILHPSEWSILESEYGYSGGGCKRETYRRINSRNWPGMSLVALIIGGKDFWDHDAYFDYADRWMLEDIEDGFSSEIIDSCGSAGSDYQSSGSEFADEMWLTYRFDHGCVYVGTNISHQTRIYDCGGYDVSCLDVLSCSDYPNERACDYDPCRIGCSSGCSEGTIHPSDTNSDGIIDITELNSYIDGWKTTSSISLSQLIEAVEIWKNS
ncbi:MAG: right-handed parallel beta-helix repeat-containing protein [Candidatus Woesearchaeota archaeon]